LFRVDEIGCLDKKLRTSAAPDDSHVPVDDIRDRTDDERRGSEVFDLAFYLAEFTLKPDLQVDGFSFVHFKMADLLAQLSIPFFKY